jgi:hypothetical protein
MRQSFQRVQEKIKRDDGMHFPLSIAQEGVQQEKEVIVPNRGQLPLEGQEGLLFQQGGRLRAEKFFSTLVRAVALVEEDANTRQEAPPYGENQWCEEDAPCQRCVELHSFDRIKAHLPDMGIQRR